MADLYANENVSFRIVDALRALGHNVLTSKQAGNANQRIPDAAVLVYADAQGRVVLTNNRKDFLWLHDKGNPHTGIIAYTVDPDAGGLAARVDAALGDPRATGRFLARVDKGGHSF